MAGLMASHCLLQQCVPQPGYGQWSYVFFLSFFSCFCMCFCVVFVLIFSATALKAVEGRTELLTKGEHEGKGANWSNFMTDSENERGKRRTVKGEKLKG